MTKRQRSGVRPRRTPLPYVRGPLAVIAATVVALLGAVPPAAADEIRDRQWHLDSLNIADAHQVTRGQGVTVAVVDTGVDAGHPDLRGNVLPGTSLDDDGGDGRTDEDGHGTRMASLIAGHGHGSEDGVLGIAPEAKILPVRVASHADSDQTAQAIRWAADHGAQLISVSLGHSDGGAMLEDAVAYAQAHDIVVVASAGNTFDGDYIVHHPAAYPGVVAISAIGRSGEFVPKLSVQGQEVDLAAPGEKIVAATNTGEYVFSEGTSGAAALISGAAALVRSKYPDLDAANVANRLVKTADDKGPRGRDPQYGLGVVNPVQALTANVPEVAKNPLGSVAQEPAQPTKRPPGPPTNTPANQAAPGGDTGMSPVIIAVIIAVVAAAVAAGIAILIVTRGRRRPARAGANQPFGPSGPPGGHDAPPTPRGPAGYPSAGPGPYPPGNLPPYGNPPAGPPRPDQPPPHWPPPGQR